MLNINNWRAFHLNLHCTFTHTLNEVIFREHLPWNNCKVPWSIIEWVPGFCFQRTHSEWFTILWSIISWKSGIPSLQYTQSQTAILPWNMNKNIILNLKLDIQFLQVVIHFLKFYIQLSLNKMKLCIQFKNVRHTVFRVRYFVISSPIFNINTSSLHFYTWDWG